MSEFKSSLNYVFACVTLGESLDISELQLCQLYNGDMKRTFLFSLVGWLARGVPFPVPGTLPTFTPVSPHAALLV